MTAHHPPVEKRSTTSGTLTLVLGVLFVVSTVFVFVLSVEELYQAFFGDYDVPNWVRAVGLVGLPVGFFGVPLGFLAARGGPGRFRAGLGLLLMLVALVAFVALQFAMG